MKTVFLHGLGQTKKDWENIVNSTSGQTECLDLFSINDGAITYSSIYNYLEAQLATEKEPFRICGISLGGILAMDYAIHHANNISALVLIGVQYKVPRFIFTIQNILFNLLPDKAFSDTGLSKKQMLKLTKSMKKLDLSKDLNKITCPVTIMCGANDKANIKASKSLDCLLLNSSLHIIPNAGHELNKEVPEVIMEVMGEGLE